MTYKEYLVPKKNGKTRKIVSPDDELKKYQRLCLPKLRSVFRSEEGKHGIRGLDIFHGFLHNRNCITAAQKHVGFKATIMMDIAHFFDSVHVNHIHPSHKLSNNLFHNDGYAAQGFPSSPMVANIAAVPVMAEIHTRLHSIARDSGFALTIYADDVFISVNRVDLSSTIQRIVTTAFNTHGFTINEQKTRIKYAKYGYRRILGVNVGDTAVRATRKTMKRIRAADYQAKTLRDKEKALYAARSKGGLVTWSKCILPKRVRKAQ